jgi:hypothetical protein
MMDGMIALFFGDYKETLSVQVHPCLQQAIIAERAVRDEETTFGRGSSRIDADLQNREKSYLGVHIIVNIILPPRTQSSQRKAIVRGI